MDYACLTKDDTDLISSVFTYYSRVQQMLQADGIKSSKEKENLILKLIDRCDKLSSSITQFLLKMKEN